MASELDTMNELLERQRASFLADGSPDAAQRKKALARLGSVIHDHQDELCDSICEDFGNRSRHETIASEFYMVLEAVRHARSKLEDWMRSERRPTALASLPGKSEIRYQPLGCVGIIGPWNYPVQLSLGPMVGALAAGNRIMLKPSEMTPRTSDLIRTLLQRTFAEEEIAVVTGGPEVGREFSGLPFDHLLFTGAPSIGRLVMKAASENLVPVTLELGGKSPAIVSRKYSIDRAASSIAYGKLFNSGQTCIEPDYVFVPDERIDEFVEAFRQHAATMYPTIADNPDYTSIINDRHFERINGMIDDAHDRGARVIALGPTDEDPAARRKIAPTVVLDVTDEMALMQDEIFGPVLPVMGYEHEDDAIRYVQDHPRPLALYYFSNDSRSVDRVLSRTISGGACINDTMMQVVQEDLPFGGVGNSGMGVYHGEYGFHTFSHARGIFHQRRINTTDLVRPPYGKRIEKLIGFLIGRTR